MSCNEIDGITTDAKRRARPHLQMDLAGLGDEARVDTDRDAMPRHAEKPA